MAGCHPRKGPMGTYLTPTGNLNKFAKVFVLFLGYSLINSPHCVHSILLEFVLVLRRDLDRSGGYSLINSFSGVHLFQLILGLLLKENLIVLITLTSS